jgi:hypothetical protein
MQKLDFAFDGGVTEGVTRDHGGKTVPTRARSVVRGQVIVGEQDIRIRRDGDDKDDKGEVVARLNAGALEIAGFSSRVRDTKDPKPKPAASGN